ncbi:hypothetical protein DFJ64_2279 [Thermasporomyces composti]|jgi:hypothetical protein|uniref:PKD domain-containing protein n=1 Tax=Thermasporomyces composti TaxID=696763 RepID=A0A3D9VCP1_THECX|nr:hypothetical protein DFJ64_2279 [Thermasporomyces composti]
MAGGGAVSRVVAAAIIAVSSFLASSGTASADELTENSCQPYCVPPQQPKPEGKRGRFVGAALFTKDGEVVSGSTGRCDGCEWLVMPTCTYDPEDDRGRCRHRPDFCLLRGDTGLPHSVQFRRRGGEWRILAYICIGSPDDVLTVEDVGEEIKRQWVAYVPKQQPRTQPPDGRALVNLPVIVHSGQPETMGPVDVNVFNFTVTVTARGEWTWSFAPGVRRTFDIPGSTYPDTRVSHTYSTTGERTITLTTAWWGRFSVGDEGPWDITTPATQGPTAIPIEVVEASPVIAK